MVTFRDIVGYRPSQARRLLRYLNNSDNSNPHPSRQPSQPSQPLFPGGQVRLLTSVPPEALGDIGVPIHQPSANAARLEESDPPPAEESQVLDDRPHAAPEPEPEIRTDPLVATTPDPQPQSLGARLLRAVWAPKAAPENAPSSGVSTLPAAVGLPVRQAGPEAARPSKPRSRPKRPRIRKKAISPNPAETAPPPQPETGDLTLIRHQARCAICRHPERDSIERAFLHWWRPSVIAYEFNLPSRLAIYRHAHAFGLFQRRNLHGQQALGYLVEQAQSVKPTADSIIRAVKALSCFDETGRYHEPRKEILITHQVINVTSPVYPEGVTSARRAGPEPADADRTAGPEPVTTAQAACPQPVTSGQRVPAHSYSIAPVGTGDSPIHLKLDSFSQTQPAKEPLQPKSSLPPAGTVRRDSPLATSHSPLNLDLIDTHDEQNPPLTPMDAVT